MDSGFEPWLARLPREEALQESVLTVDALLMRTTRGRVRLVVGRLYLDVDEADVVRVVERPWPNREPRLAAPVQVSLRVGFRVTDIGPTWAYRGLLSPQRPFAISARPDPAAVTGSASFRDRERRFLQSHGIETTDAT